MWCFLENVTILRNPVYLVLGTDSKYSLHEFVNKVLKHLKINKIKINKKLIRKNETILYKSNPMLAKKKIR